MGNTEYEMKVIGQKLKALYNEEEDKKNNRQAEEKKAENPQVEESKEESKAVDN